jgi:hypothetical protein
MEQAFALEPGKFPPVMAWPLPQHPVQWVPFHSQFPTYVPCTVNCGGGSKSSSNGGSNGNNGGSGNGNSGGNGGGSGGPPPTT